MSDGDEINIGSDPLVINKPPAQIKLWLEAEDGNVSAPMQISHDSEASSGGYIEVPNGQGNASSPSRDTGYAEYVFNVPSAGDYVIWGRVLASVL